MKLQQSAAAPTPLASGDKPAPDTPAPRHKSTRQCSRRTLRPADPTPPSVPKVTARGHTCRPPAAAPASPQGRRGTRPRAGSAAAACAGSASLAGHGSAAPGNRARWGLSAPAAHRAPSLSSSGPSLRAHTHLTSARIKARGTAPDGSPRRSSARLRCRCSARTTRRAHSSACRGCCKPEWVGGRRRGEGNRQRGQDLPPNSGAALARSQPPADLKAVATSDHRL